MCDCIILNGTLYQYFPIFCLILVVKVTVFGFSKYERMFLNSELSCIFCPHLLRFLQVRVTTALWWWDQLKADIGKKLVICRIISWWTVSSNSPRSTEHQMCKLDFFAVAVADGLYVFFIITEFVAFKRHEEINRYDYC